MASWSKHNDMAEVAEQQLDCQNVTIFWLITIIGCSACFTCNIHLLQIRQIGNYTCGVKVESYRSEVMSVSVAKNKIEMIPD